MAKKRFQKINVEISNICNLQCSFCPAVVREKKLMTVELFQKIIEQIAPLTEQVCFHLMGDPLVHPKLNEFVSIAHQAQLPIFLVTNGVLLRALETELLLHPAFRQVNFSLHSFADNFGDKDPLPYLTKIFNYTERAFSKRPDLYINYRLWNLNSPLGEKSENKTVLQHVEDYFHFQVPDAVDVRTQKSVRIKNRLYLHFDTEFVWPGLELPILGTQGTCYGLSSHIGILVDGTVVPCCLDKEAAIPLGKIQDRALTAILNDARAQNILNGFRKNILVEELCQRCQYIERFQTAQPATLGI